MRTKFCLAMLQMGEQSGKGHLAGSSSGISATPPPCTPAEESKLESTGRLFVFVLVLSGHCQTSAQREEY